MLLLANDTVNHIISKGEIYLNWIVYISLNNPQNQKFCGLFYYGINKNKDDY